MQTLKPNTQVEVGSAQYRLTNMAILPIVKDHSTICHEIWSDLSVDHQVATTFFQRQRSTISEQDESIRLIPFLVEKETKLI